MKRMIRSSVLLAASLGLWSCSSDQLADEAGVPTAIVATPTVAFVTQGETQLIKFGLVDELGGLIPSTWTIGAAPAAYTVTFDSTFRVVYNSDGSLTLPENQSEIRATITGISGGSGTFTVSASGISQDFTVGVVPTGFSATVAPADVVFGTGDTTTVTMPAGYALSPTSTFTAGTANPSYVVSMAGDGSTADIILTPGSTGPLVISGVLVDFLPGTPLTLPTETSVSRPAQDDPATAPSITLPAVGSSLTFTDPVGDAVDQFYHFTVNGTESIRATISWAGGADVDLLWCTADCSAFVGNFSGATGANPEVSTVLLAAGTYTLWLNRYDDHDDPPVAYTIMLENLAP